MWAEILDWTKIHIIPDCPKIIYALSGQSFLSIRGYFWESTNTYFLTYTGVASQWNHWYTENIMLKVQEVRIVIKLRLSMPVSCSRAGGVPVAVLPMQPPTNNVLRIAVEDGPTWLEPCTNMGDQDPGFHKAQPQPSQPFGKQTS